MNKSICGTLEKYTSAKGTGGQSAGGAIVYGIPVRTKDVIIRLSRRDESFRVRFPQWIYDILLGRNSYVREYLNSVPKSPFQRIHTFGIFKRSV